MPKAITHPFTSTSPRADDDGMPDSDDYAHAITEYRAMAAYLSGILLAAGVHPANVRPLLIDVAAAGLRDAIGVSRVPAIESMNHGRPE